MLPEAASAQAKSEQRERRLVSAGEWWTLGAFAAGAAVVAPLDGQLARQFERPTLHQIVMVDRTARAIRAFGDPGILLLSVGSFAAGRLTHRPTLADAGWHATEAVLLSGALTAVIKPLVGRARPYVVAHDDADVFRPASGAAGYTSFPSGHTTVAFAAASAASSEIARSGFAKRHPTAARMVAPALFGSAALVGVSRMYHAAHWGSDVMAAAGIGTVTGHLVVRRQHAGPPGRIERYLLPARVMPVPGGGAAVWSVTFR